MTALGSNLRANEHGDYGLDIEIEGHRRMLADKAHVAESLLHRLRLQLEADELHWASLSLGGALLNSAAGIERDVAELCQTLRIAEANPPPELVPDG